MKFGSTYEVQLEGDEVGIFVASLVLSVGEGYRSLCMV